MKVGGKSHDDAFTLLGNRSAPIILPFGPPKPVSKSKRELVQVILVSQGYDGPERALYEFIEAASRTLTSNLLAPSYRRVTFLEGGAATLPAFAAALGSAAGPAVEAVDVLVTTHGRSEAMEFAEGPISEEAVGEELLGLAPAKRQKLRAVFSTACFGATHLDTWRKVGFTEASGSEGIYADSAVSYAPFLAAWASEKTFAQAVAAANAADLGNVSDNLVRAYYVARGMADHADLVDSDRRRRGTGRSRIYSRP